MISKSIMAVVLLTCTLSSFGTTYYVDSTRGHDSSNGLTPDTAWKTLEKVNQTSLSGGDQLLFVAGTVYYGQLCPQGGGSLQDDNPLLARIGVYGEGPRPRIDAQGRFKSALYLHNTQYWSISGLELTNTGPERQSGRCGVHIHIREYGTARSIHLKDLYIHDVNGSLVKKDGGGFGILWQNEGRRIPSRFDGLTIEKCHLVRCERDGIKGRGYTNRDAGWFPSLNVIIRDNLLEEIPGDGIVPLACDGALVEYNRMRNCTRLLPQGDAAAGIWPWACDNTIIQFNEVSDHKAPWDAQGFDSDWNCRGTIIQYNYSHDNEGGFLLVCCNGQAAPATRLCADTIVRYNISVNDGLRTTGKSAGFSPTFHISGPVTNTKIYNNVIYVPTKPKGADQTLIKMDNWGGPWPVDTWFANNIFYVIGETRYDWGKSINHRFENNLFYGTHKNEPQDKTRLTADPQFAGPFGSDNLPQTIKSLILRPDSPCIDAGKTIPNNGKRDYWGNPVTGQVDIGAYEAPNP